MADITSKVKEQRIKEKERERMIKQLQSSGNLGKGSRQNDQVKTANDIYP